MFGTIAGGSIGLIVNLISYIWFASGSVGDILSYTILGTVIGLFCGKNIILNKKNILRFNAVQGIANVILFVILVPVLEAFYTGGIKAGIFMLAFANWNEHLKLAFANMISIGVWGTLLLFLGYKFRKEPKSK